MDKKNQSETDAIIIGGGPVGIFTIFQAGMLGIKTELIDSLPELGGQCTALYPEKFIYDIPAYPKITAKNLIEKLAEQAEKFLAKYHLNSTVEKITKNENHFIVETNNNLQIKCKAVIIAAGAGAFDYNKIPLPNLERFENHSLFYNVQKKEIFTNKNVVIAGGGDSAIDWVITLSDIAKKIYLVHRRSKFRCMEGSFVKIKQLESLKKIEIIAPYQIKNIEGNNNQITDVILSNFNDEIKNIKADYLLAFFGLKTYLKHIQNWGIEIHNHHIVVDKEDYSTNIEGIYAIGDIISYPGKLKLILSGFAESATVCHSILHKFFKDKPYNFQYSTNMEIF